MWYFLDVHSGAIQSVCATLALLTAIVGVALLLQSLKATRTDLHPSK